MDARVLAQEIPQANSLDKIRAVVEAVGAGIRDNEEMLGRTELSPRHLNYYVAAAHTLGLLDRGDQGAGWGRVSELGVRLLGATKESDREAQVFREAIRHSSVMQAIAPALLGNDDLTLAQLTDRIETISGLSRSTSERRAETLLTWRKRLVEKQLCLFDMT